VEKGPIVTCQAKNWTLRKRDRKRGRDAFTLLELTAVLALSAALFALAMFSWRTPLQSSQFENTLERIKFFDRNLREHAIRFNVFTKLKINLADGKLTAVREGATDGGERTLRLNPLFRIERVQTSLRQTSYGTATIDISAQGQSSSYSLQLIDANSRRHWLFFAGVTGQVLRIDNENDAREIHRLLAKQRADAN
jgi:prepilin-type N-terminal cleavage/methylation domain-containing protein